MLMPSHLVIIPDGNRRWAKEKSKSSIYGHIEGYERIKELIRFSKEKGISTLTIWAFSTENWKRSTDEIGVLFNIINKGLLELYSLVQEEDTRIIHIGRRDRFTQETLGNIESIESETKDNKGFCLCIAIDYGGEDEIRRAGQALCYSNDKTKTVVDFLDTTLHKIPNPDLIIRTGGEKRTSGFIPLQSAYSEWIFEERMFPDFTKEVLQNSFDEYSKRVRRFGK